MLWRSFTIPALLLLMSCGSEPTSQTDEATTVVEPSPSTEASPSVEPIEAKLSQEEQARVCRAVIADLNGHSPAIMRVTSSDGSSVIVRYNRPDDGKAWTNECRFEGDRVIWRTIGAFGGTEPGRWRDTAADEDIRFTIDGDKVTVTTTYSDDSGGSETYVVQ